MVNSHCFVFGCDTGYRSCTKKIPLFSAPKTITSFLNWKVAVGRKHAIFTKTSKMCAKHFKEESIIKGYVSNGSNGTVLIPFKNWRLQIDAVPTLHLGECVSRKIL